MRRIAYLAVVILAADAASCRAQDRLAEAAPNSWVKLAVDETGFRNRPLFYFDPHVKAFVVSGGEQSKDAHADTEHFDRAASVWRNAFPAGATVRPERGPAPGVPGEWYRKDGAVKRDKDGVARILRSVNPYEWDPGLYQQWAYNASDGMCYANLQGFTLRFDARTSEWADLKIPKFAKEHTSFFSYSTMAYDPVNKQMISIGGTSDEDGGTPGTWTLNPADGEWKRLPQGSERLRELGGEAKALTLKLSAAINAWRNRFYRTESPTEAKRDLGAEARACLTANEAFADRVRLAKLEGREANAARRALAILEPANAQWKTLAETAPAAMTGETLVAAQGVLETYEAMQRALDVEPSGRAAAGAVTCAGKDAIVLFGGCRMDGYLGDTWVFDCKTRTWEQRYPKVSPAPRAGQVMAWLPKSKKVLLYGAVPFSSPYGVPHGNASPPQDLWVYDLDANEWTPLAAAAKDNPLAACGAVDENDVLIVTSRDPKSDRKRITWGMQVRPDRPAAGAAKGGVESGGVAIVFETPAAFDKVAAPDPAAVAKALTAAPANQWTLLPKPPRTINSHPWGTCPYDTVRHQYLSFGGGHSSAHFNDLAHYSVRTATWSWGYGEEFPYASASFSAFFNQTFKNRPTVPTHVWDGAAFDEASGKAVYCMRSATWVYDPATRAWEYPPVWQNGGGSMVNMKGTPYGVVYWDSQGQLQKYDVAARTWTKLPVKGSTLSGAYGDTGGIVYDSKRDCLWLGHGAAMTRYDMKTGTATTLPAPGKPEHISMRATTYVPELDMIVSAGRQPLEGGASANLAYDIAGEKWVGLPLPCSDRLPRTTDKAYSQINLSLHYDPVLKLAVWHSNQQEILVGRFDAQSLKPVAVTLQKAKKS